MRLADRSPDLRPNFKSGVKAEDEEEGEMWLRSKAFSGIAYNEPAAMDARRRIAAFFHTHVG